MADTIKKDYCCMSNEAYHNGECNKKMLLCYKAAKFTIMADAMKKYCCSASNNVYHHGKCDKKGYK